MPRPRNPTLVFRFTRGAAPRRWALLALVALFLAGCRLGRPVSPSPGSSSPNPAQDPPGLALQVQAGAFRVLAAAGDRQAAGDVAAALAAAAPQVCADLDIECGFPVTVELYSDQAAFDQAVMNPAYRGYYAISGAGRLQMLSPANPTPTVDLPYAGRVGIAVHEFVHLALDQIEPDLPAWLDEGAAVYLGPHAAYTAACRRGLPPEAIPTLADLENRYASVVAPDLFSFTLVDFIVAQAGLQGLNALLRSPAALEDVLGMPRPEIETGWRAWLGAYSEQ